MAVRTSAEEEDRKVRRVEVERSGEAEVYISYQPQQRASPQLRLVLTHG